MVRKVDAGAGEVTIRHEAIAGYMPAMTMPFRVESSPELAEVRPGDEVEATLRVSPEGSRLRGLAVTRPAPSTLDLSGAAPALRPAQLRLEPGEAVPDFAMTGQDGRTLRLSELRGRVVVLTFIYTRCPLPDFCPAMDRKFAKVADQVAAVPGRAGRVALLSVSFDPEHDSPEVLRKHAASQGARPPLWEFAAAAHDELSKVAAPLGLTYGPTKDEIIHNLIVAVIDPAGRLARLEVGSAAGAWPPGEILKAVIAAGAGRG